MLRMISNMLSGLLDRATGRDKSQGQHWVSSSSASQPTAGFSGGDVRERVLEHTPPDRSAIPGWMRNAELPEPTHANSEDNEPRLSWGDIPEIHRTDGQGWEERMKQRQPDRGPDLDR